MSAFPAAGLPDLSGRSRPVSHWAAAARPAAAAAARDPAKAHWLRCGGTWFVGVDALPNDAQGRVGERPAARRCRHGLHPRRTWHFPCRCTARRSRSATPAIRSPRREESEAAFSFRLKRDAAHVDGLLAEGPEQAPHPEGAARLYPRPDADRAIRRRSTAYRVGGLASASMRDMFEKAARRPCAGDLARHRPHRRLSGGAPRRSSPPAGGSRLPSAPGEAVLLHRHLLHGVAPWGEVPTASADGRMIAYFRPEFPKLAGLAVSAIAAGACRKPA